ITSFKGFNNLLCLKKLCVKSIPTPVIIFPEANVTIETNVVTIKGPVIQVAEIAAGFFYAAFVLKPDKRKSMITSLSKILAISKESTDAKKQGQFSMPINRLLVEPYIK
ncbi:hypothetical protein IDH09_02415, partial [Pelagibacterales bacterium SAG-MED28]|nr:hypothetical protein [Pelagibacterales bacterium SAG-MED28]